MAVDGGSGRRPSQQEVETVRRKSDAQSPEIRVGVLAKIFDFFRFSNLFLANANQPTPLASSTVPSLLQDKFAESSKGHFLCCETKLVTSRKNCQGWPVKCQHIVTLKIKLPLPLPYSDLQEVGA